MSFDPADPIGSVFAEIIGKPAWQVRRGYGSFVTLEFGEPRLVVREPHETAAKSKAVRRRAAQRLVSVRGDWHLWIYCCGWRVTQEGERLAHNESKDGKMSRAMAALNGQILTGVEVDPETAATRFTFDLGGVLETKRWKKREDYEQWLLYAPDGQVLTLRDDARYSFGPGSQRPDEYVWLPLPG